MGLDITFYKAKRSKDNETKERLEEIRKALDAEYIKSIGDRKKEKQERDALLENAGIHSKKVKRKKRKKNKK